MRTTPRAKGRSDQRGVAALEFSLVAMLMILLFLPIVDLCVAAVDYITAFAALRNYGAYVQYHPPSDVTNLGSWTTPSGYNITTQVYCGDASPFACSSSATDPKWFVFTTSFTLTPMFLTALAGRYTLTYTERLQ